MKARLVSESVALGVMLDGVMGSLRSDLDGCCAMADDVSVYLRGKLGPVSQGLRPRRPA